VAEKGFKVPTFSRQGEEQRSVPDRRHQTVEAVKDRFIVDSSHCTSRERKYKYLRGERTDERVPSEEQLQAILSS
jgi:hypothetical protein